MGHGLILYESSRGGRWGGEGCSSGADFTLENSGNGAGKEELRSRGGLLSTFPRWRREEERDSNKNGSWPNVARKTARGRNVEGGVKRKRRGEIGGNRGDAKREKERRRKRCGGTKVPEGSRAGDIILALSSALCLYSQDRERGRAVWHVAGCKDVKGQKG